MNINQESRLISIRKMKKQTKSVLKLHQLLKHESLMESDRVLFPEEEQF